MLSYKISFALEAGLVCGLTHSYAGTYLIERKGGGERPRERLRVGGWEACED